MDNTIATEYEAAYSVGDGPTHTDVRTLSAPDATIGLSISTGQSMNLRPITCARNKLVTANKVNT